MQYQWKNINNLLIYYSARSRQTKYQHSITCGAVLLWDMIKWKEYYRLKVWEWQKVNIWTKKEWELESVKFHYYHLYHLPNIRQIDCIYEIELSRTYNQSEWQIAEGFKILTFKPRGNRLLGKLRHNGKKLFEWNLEKNVWNCMEFIKTRDYCRVLVNLALKPTIL